MNTKKSKLGLPYHGFHLNYLNYINVDEKKGVKYCDFDMLTSEMLAEEFLFHGVNEYLYLGSRISKDFVSLSRVKRISSLFFVRSMVSLNTHIKDVIVKFEECNTDEPDLFKDAILPRSEKITGCEVIHSVDTYNVIDYVHLIKASRTIEKSMYDNAVQKYIEVLQDEINIDTDVIIEFEKTLLKNNKDV